MVEVGEELHPFGGAFAGRQAEVDDLLFAISPQPKATTTGLRRARVPISRERAMPSSVGALERFCNGHRRNAVTAQSSVWRLGSPPRHSRAAEQGQQRLAHLADRRAEQEAGEHRLGNLARAARIAANELERAIAAGPRKMQLDIAEFGQRMPPAGRKLVATRSDMIDGATL
jgi:hypothetical protein